MLGATGSAGSEVLAGRVDAQAFAAALYADDSGLKDELELSCSVPRSYGDAGEVAHTVFAYASGERFGVAVQAGAVRGSTAGRWFRPRRSGGSSSPSNGCGRRG